MLAISIAQPWAWCILRPDVLDQAERARLRDKDHMPRLANITWASTYRGPVVIHAAATLDHRSWNYIEDELGIDLPEYSSLVRGSFVGYVDVVDCVDYFASPWFRGPFAFVLENPRPMAPQRARGKLGLFPTALSAASIERFALCR